MSEPLRIAMVVEGTTDFIVLDAVISSLLPDQDIEFQAIQPEFSAAFQVDRVQRGWDGRASTDGAAKLQMKVKAAFQVHRCSPSIRYSLCKSMPTLPE